MQKPLTLAIDWWPIDRVRPYEGNPRIITQAAIEKVADSISQFGWRQPIVVDEDGVILVGHTRLQAAIFLKQEHVPVHVAKGLTPAQAKAYRLADNRVAEETEWNLDALKDELQALEALGADLAITGFDADSLASMLSAAPTVEAPTDFKVFDETIETNCECPKCGYKWSRTE